MQFVSAAAARDAAYWQKRLPRSIFMSQDIRPYDIKKRPVLANRTKYTRCTTYYCILTYEFPLTVENRADLLARGFPGRSDASLGVIFHLHPAPGFHHPRLALAFHEFPLTVENRADLLARGFPGRSDASLGVIFHLHPAPGFHHPRLALAFLQIYCLRHRLFLCVTPFYYKDSAKKSQGLGILHFCYFFNKKFAFSFHYCYNVGNDMGYYTRRKYYE